MADPPKSAKSGLFPLSDRDFVGLAGADTNLAANSRRKSFRRQPGQCEHSSNRIDDPWESSSETTISIFTLGKKSTAYSAPR